MSKTPPPAQHTPGTAFERLLTVLNTLRSDCPWDRKQTMLSLRHLSIEEMYEPFLIRQGLLSRTSRGRIYFALMGVYTAVGLWHGASWTFVVWGGLHGTYLAVERYLTERFSGRRVFTSTASRIATTAGPSGSWARPTRVPAQPSSGRLFSGVSRLFTRVPPGALARCSWSSSRA